MSPSRQQALGRVLSEPELFSREIIRRPLRHYQLAVAQAVVDSVLHGRGHTYAVMMARQAGKNETAAHIEALLLSLFRRKGGFTVKAAPTFQPQCVNSMLRLNAITTGTCLPPLVSERGYILRLGQARAMFFSATPESNVVGATANLLLEADEAQDMDETKWNKAFRPMGASTNVTTVLWGTAWTSGTMLAQSIRALRWLEGRDGCQRVFTVPWRDVAAEVPAYGQYVEGEMARLGRSHPLIRTQYDLEEIDDEAGMFNGATRALMRGSHERQREPTEGRAYALLLDVAGAVEDRIQGELLRQQEPTRDSTALTIVELVPDSMGLARYLVMDRYLWTGTPHPDLYGAILNLAERWQARRVVVDATGVGAGLCGFLQQALGQRVKPFTFTAKSKSDLGWAFLGICNSGRFLDYRDEGGPERRQFWREVEAADYQVLDGPQKTMRWGVADPRVHDDLLISAALCAALEEEAVRPPLPSHIIEAEDPLG